MWKGKAQGVRNEGLLTESINLSGPAYLWKDVLYMMDPIGAGWVGHVIKSQPFKFCIHHKRITC